jgi:hypothetical protein
LKILEKRKLRLLEKAARKHAIQVVPTAVKYAMTKDSTMTVDGGVRDGEWDTEVVPINQADFLEPLRAILQDRENWNDSGIFQKLMVEPLPPGMEAVATKLSSLDSLYTQLKGGDVSSLAEDPIQVSIGRHGDILLNHADDRFAVAMIAKAPTIPVRVTCRHRDWDNFKEEVLSVRLNRTSGGKQLYAPVLHPDLQWIPSKHSHQRFEVMKRSLGERNRGTVLDIGCNWGYFCHRFEDLGFECTGVEHDAELVYFLQKLKRAENKSFKIIHGSIFDYINEESPRYDVVLALAVFHWFIISEESYNAFLRLLNNLRMSEMFFIPHKPSERQMQNAYWNPNEDEFVAFLLDKTGLNHAAHLGYVDGNRSIYHLSC